MDAVYPLIMAGGEGTRFHPLSTPERPKQFLHLIGGSTFLRQTFERAARLAKSERIYVSTNERHVGLVRSDLPEVASGNIIGEQAKKNTGPALAYAAAVIAARDKDAVMVCLPCDHYIADEDGFIAALKKGIEVALDGYLVTIGMVPSWPSPEYGYIRPERQGSWSKVASFKEKPDAKTAERYITEGCLWNGGVFIWRVNAFLDEVKAHAPQMLFTAGNANDARDMRRYFANVQSISVDYAVMERSKRVAVVPASVGWSDLGTWDSIMRLMDDGAEVSEDVRRVLKGDEFAPDRRIVPKPWGHEEIWAAGPKYAGKVLFIRKGKRLSLQYHKVKEETLRMLSGEMVIEIGEGRTRKMSPGDVHHIAPGTRHRMTAISDCLVLEVSTPELDDVVRIDDDYGRRS